MKITPKVPVLVLANGTRYLLIKNGVHTIGSDPACSIVLSDAGLDPLHMTLVVMNGSVLIQPHAAQILLNDDFLAQQQYLRDGDTVVTEGLVFTLAYEAAPAAPAADDDPFALPSSDFEEISPYIASEKTRFSGQGNYLDPDTRDDDDDMPPPPRYVSQPISPAASSDDDFALDDADLIQPTGDVDDDDDMPAPVTRGGVRLHDDDGDDDEQYGTQAPSRGATPIQPSPLVPSASAPQRSARDAAPDDVFFTAYYPRDAFVGRDMRFLVYAHIDALRDQIAGDAEQFVSQLGGSMPRPRSAKGSTSIHEGTPITVQIVSDTLDFEPISDTTQRWNGQSVRFDFSFQAPDALVNDTVTADVLILIEGIEIAAIRRCAIEIAAAPSAATQPAPSAKPINALAAAKQARMAQQQAALHKRIFVSYSVKDKAVAEAYRFAQLALNNDVFMDYYSLQSGANWQAALADAIDTADIFQLFWSKHAAESQHVRDEWEYALQSQADTSDASGFILPVYWRAPLTPPPGELSHLHFRFVQFTVADADDEGDDA